MMNDCIFNLLFAPCDSFLSNFIKEVLKDAENHPEILNKIEEDLLVYALEKKRKRILDQQYRHRESPELNDEFIRKTENPEVSNLELLDTGRNKMSSEEVFLFLMLEGYWGSLTDQKTVDIMKESSSLYIYYASKMKPLPKSKTIHENVRAVSIDTIRFIHQCQLKDILNEGLDNFNYEVADSTSVFASSCWPTDALIIFRLLKRVYTQICKLEKFELDNIAAWYIPDWMKRMKELLFEINNTKGSPNNPKADKIKKPYRQFLNTAHNMFQYLIREFEKKTQAVRNADLLPTKKEQLNFIWNKIEEDLLALSPVLYYTEERVFCDVKLPSIDKILSISDTTAAFIKKGQRNPVIGYKPQIGMSSCGFVSAFILEKGNGADSKYLVPLVENHILNTGVTPDFLNVDDGYSSTKGRDDCLKLGVKDVCFSGAKGKKILGEEIWLDDDYVNGRRKRSAVESLMYTLKYVFYFARMRRRGLKAVEKEMLCKIIAYNYKHKLTHTKEELHKRAA